VLGVPMRCGDAIRILRWPCVSRPAEFRVPSDVTARRSQRQRCSNATTAARVPSPCIFKDGHSIHTAGKSDAAGMSAPAINHHEDRRSPATRAHCHRFVAAWCGDLNHGQPDRRDQPPKARPSIAASAPDHGRCRHGDAANAANCPSSRREP